MASAADEFKEYADDPQKLRDSLRDTTEEMFQALNDDEDFCGKDIDSTIQYVQTMQKKFIKKFQDLQKKLEELRTENMTVSEENRQRLDKEITEINGLLDAGKEQEGLLENLLFYSRLFIFFF